MDNVSRSRTVTIVDPEDHKSQRFYHILGLIRTILKERSKDSVLATLEDGLKNSGVKYVVFGTNHRSSRIDDFIDITEIPTEDSRVLLWIYSCTYGAEKEEIVAIRHIKVSRTSLCCIA